MPSLRPLRLLLPLCVGLALSACSSSSTDADSGAPRDAGPDLVAASDLGDSPDAPAPSDLGGSPDAPATADLGATTDSGPPGIDAGPLDLGLPTGDAGAPAAEGCFTDVTAGHHLFSCDGIDYDVELSATCAAGGCGLIFDVHGATMTATVEDLNTNLRALGSAAGYVVVQPTAPSGGVLGPSWVPARDDPKVFAFLVLTARVMRTDLHRIHFTGFSQGGFMSWRMLCAHADLLASVAPAAACGTLFPQCSFTPGDTPSQELPVLYLHGSRDNIVPGCSHTMRDTVVAGWSMTPAADVSMDADYTWSRWTDAAGNDFEFIDHSYTARSTILGGHCMPGSPDIGTSAFGITGFGCDHTSPVTWGAAVLAFFQAHPRP